MKQTQFLANRIREVYLNGTWIANTNFKTQLESITWIQAIRNIENINTIAILTFHVNYYLKGLIQVFEGGALQIKDKYSFDMPDIISEADWKHLVNDFLLNAEKFASLIEQFDESMLDQYFVDEKYGTYQRNIEGVIEHSYYHLGQITLIKKLLSTN